MYQQKAVVLVPLTGCSLGWGLLTASWQVSFPIHPSLSYIYHNTIFHSQYHSPLSFHILFVCRWEHFPCGIDRDVHHPSTQHTSLTGVTRWTGYVMQCYAVLPLQCSNNHTVVDFILHSAHVHVCAYGTWLVTILFVSHEISHSQQMQVIWKFSLQNFFSGLHKQSAHFVHTVSQHS